MTVIVLPNAPRQSLWRLELCVRFFKGDTRAQAEAAMAKAGGASAPLKGVRVLSLPEPPSRQWLRVPRAEVDQQARLLALPATAFAGGFRPCASPP